MGKQWKTVSDFILGISKITAGGDCSHETKRRFLLGREVMTNLDSILKSRHITFPYIISRVFLFSSGKYAEGELLDLINVLFSVLGRGGACHIILHSGHSKFQFQQRYLRVPFLHIPTNPHYFSLFYDNRSNRCEVISQFAVDLHFPEDEWCWESFQVHVSPCMSPLIKVV